MKKRGFTLIEVALFLAITGALFVSITVGVQNSISQQRINDSVQNFTDFLRNVYSETTNIQNLGGGKSERAIYGRLITFGESTNPNGDTIPADQKRNAIFVYDVIGDVGETSAGSALSTLNALNANVAVVEDGTVKPAGIVVQYTPKWTAGIEPPCIDGNCTDTYQPFIGALLIVRHPNSGIVYTYVMKNHTIEVNQEISKLSAEYKNTVNITNSDATNEQKAAAEAAIDNISRGKEKNILRQYIAPSNAEQPHFERQDADFCVNPYHGEVYHLRRDIRIPAGTMNSSGIEIIPDGANNRCEPGD